MVALYIVLGIVAFLLLILLIPVYGYLDFDKQLHARVRVLGIPFRLYPLKPKKKRSEKQQTVAKAEKSAKKSAKKEAKEGLLSLETIFKEEGISGVAQLFSELAKLATAALRRVLAAITVDRLNLQARIVCEEADETAIRYGQVCAVLYPALAGLESVVRVRKKNIAIAPDFLAEKGELVVDLRLHIIPLRVLWAALRFAVGFLGYTNKV